MIHEPTLGIAILLAVGLLVAKLCQLVRLPSVTGFIVAGLVLGPSCFGILTVDTVGHQLDHFTQIALMLIAFGIGEHIELRRLGQVARDVGYIAVVQAVAAFVLVMLATFVTSLLVGRGEAGVLDRFVLALLLGAVSVATAPAAVLHVVRETGARGVLTSTLMAVVAVDDGIAIMIFGMALAAAHQLVGQGDVSPLAAVAGSLVEIGCSLGMGLLMGLSIDGILHKLHNRSEMLTGGLALLLLGGEVTRLLHLSPLLAGMVAGFTIINRAERDVRLFRAINNFEPPVYVLFFTLAGVHLDLSALQLAGWVGLVYFVVRIAGKYLGTWLGAFWSGASLPVRRYLGLALIPQAGVAIGLIFMISSDPQLGKWATVITPVVLAGVILSELVGPPLAHFCLEKAGETAGRTAVHPSCGDRGPRTCRAWLRSPEGISLAPWNGSPLQPAANPRGVVVFESFHFATNRGLARIATILAHHYHALPMAVRVFSKSERGRLAPEELDSLFLPEEDEVRSLGYSLLREVVYDSRTSGIVAAAEYNHAHCIVLGYPVGRNPLAFQRELDQVVANVLCPVIAVRFVGTLLCERILVPFLFPRELDGLLPLLEAMATAGQPRITFLHLLHADCSHAEIEASDRWLEQWLENHFFDTETEHLVEAAESRLEAILHEARYHDLITMTGTASPTIRRIFLGSLASAVVQNCRNPVCIVYLPTAAEAGQNDSRFS